MNIAKLLILLIGGILFLVYLEDIRRNQDRGYNETIKLISSLTEEDISEVWVSSELWTGKEKITSFKDKRDIAGFLKTIDDIEKSGHGSIGKVEAWDVDIIINPLNVYLFCHIRANVTEYLYCRLGANNSSYGNFRSKKIRDWVESLE